MKHKFLPQTVQTDVYMYNYAVRAPFGRDYPVFVKFQYAL